MFEEDIIEVNTKLKAYKLIHDPTVLLNLIYSKYGDIEEDFELLYINQLVYDKSSRYNIYFKEYQFYFNDDEYLKRYYKKYDSKPRIPKLSEYYKNYHVFFCRPRFKDLVVSDLIQSYEDDRAELFYKKNFEDSNSKDDDKDKSEKRNSESLSSLDNITDNKIIFTKKTKKIIDKNLESNAGTLTLTSNSFNINSNNNNNINNNNNKDKNNSNIINKINNDDGLISSRDVNDSFEKIVHNLIYFKKNKKKTEKNKNKNNNIKKKEKTKKEDKPYIQGKNYICKNINNNNFNNINRKGTGYLNNKMSLFSLLKQNNTINYSKKNKNVVLNNKNKNNLNEAFFSPKMNKENLHFSTKLEEFHNNLIKQNNTSHHHQRNKTFNFNQNQTTGNTTNNLTNIINMNNNNSRNNNLKQMSQLNNFLTVGNNIVNGIKVSSNKNKTFDNTPNFNNSLVKKIPTKILPKNNKNQNNDNHNNNQIIIKRNNLAKSKFNLVKNPLSKNNLNNKIKLNKNIKNNNFKYYNTKFSPSNCIYKNLLSNNNMNINLHKKNKTTYLTTMFEVSPKNNAASPKITNKQRKQFYNINKSDNISSKIKPKIAKGRINNLNINFNNVIFNAPLSNINENINFNNNNSNSFNLVSVSNNNYRNNGNSHTFLNNNYLNNSSNTNTNNNLSEGENPNDKNIYILNLKNVYNNISRNKTNIYGSSFTQSENYSLPSTNAKILYEKNKVINHTYSNLYSTDKQELLNNKNNKISIKKSYNKSGNQKNTKKIIRNSVKKSNKSIKSKNKKNDNNNHVLKNEKSKRSEKREKNNNSFQHKEKENHNKKLYLSPKTTGRNNIPQPINVNRNSNLFSKNLTKSRKKIK